MQYKTVHFRLIHPSKEISAIYLRFIYDNQRLECSTGMSIPTKHWDKKKKFPSSKIADHDAYKARLDRLEKEVKAITPNALKRAGFHPQPKSKNTLAA